MTEVIRRLGENLAVILALGDIVRESEECKKQLKQCEEELQQAKKMYNVKIEKVETRKTTSTIKTSVDRKITECARQFVESKIETNVNKKVQVCETIVARYEL